jgi:phage FluMu protein Com
MSIEFQCPNCSQMLRVPETAAGKQAKCPKCQTLANVPGATPAPEQPTQPMFFGAPQEQPSKPAPASENPYATAPMAGGGFASGPAAEAGEIRNVQVDVSDVISHAWECWKRDLGILVVASLVAGFASQVVAIPAGIVIAVLRANGEHEIAAIVNGASSLLSMPIQVYFMMGLMAISLASARGQQVELGMIFYRADNTMGALGAILLFMFLIFLAVLACIIPGILVALFFWPFYFLVVDKRVGLGETFSMARVITTGNSGATILLWLASIGISIVGLLACCVGFIFAYPLTQVMWATGYLMMSGQLQFKRPGSQY